MTIEFNIQVGYTGEKFPLLNFRFPKDVHRNKKSIYKKDVFIHSDYPISIICCIYLHLLPHQHNLIICSVRVIYWCVSIHSHRGANIKTISRMQNMLLRHINLKKRRRDTAIMRRNGKFQYKCAHYLNEITFFDSKWHQKTYASYSFCSFAFFYNPGRLCLEIMKEKNRRWAWGWKQSRPFTEMRSKTLGNWQILLLRVK